MLHDKKTEAEARRVMEGFCRVCRYCDGRSCAGEVPGMGGTGTGSSFFANVKALEAVRLNMRTIHGVRDPNTACTFLSHSLAFPAMAAPLGGVAFNMSKKSNEASYINAVVTGCRDAGTIAGTGDGEEEIIHHEACRAIAGAGGYGIPFIKPWEGKEIVKKAEEARKAGARQIGIDIDASGLITLKLMGKPVFPRKREELASLIKEIDMPVILKGIMTADEAKAAVDAGACAIVVSNHGGRVLDATPGTAEVLPKIAEVVKGRIPLLVDGGIRSGIDLFKMLALGADFALIGRPVAVAALGGGRAAVRTLMETLQQELYRTMVMTGCASLSEIDRSSLA
ncbi:alpha-hydroxy-acid oxidizing protein [Sediminispirochaeta smaragdinae]|uniref:FMN-dependent alpha-hydroxy acid dehydrogenase n=1 Tax=Sediminispirochaeta smaragdinae (strain DSM 11293 / JCM 15392 / SEBR 4228) TaxID=573413 RepID=E1R563_SEDSS|nr:alpha-hydroxy-acid oxidizing protein [Sediminispirochaeta smaragdinae]ADK80598.1 FMN-dependent alpha-hydroxy acid dehydrogenase [Sediminispirochaeta smaragdinae DSM 11293]